MERATANRAVTRLSSAFPLNPESIQGVSGRILPGRRGPRQTVFPHACTSSEGPRAIRPVHTGPECPCTPGELSQTPQALWRHALDSPVPTANLCCENDFRGKRGFAKPDLGSETHEQPQGVGVCSRGHLTMGRGVSPTQGSTSRRGAQRPARVRPHVQMGGDFRLGPHTHEGEPGSRLPRCPTGLGAW